MPAENDQQPIGDPVPLLREELGHILTRLMSLFVVVATGIVAFGFFLVPTRTMGATRSGKLQLQERQREVNQAVPAPKPDAPNAPEENRRRDVH